MSIWTGLFVILAIISLSILYQHFRDRGGKDGHAERREPSISPIRQSDLVDPESTAEIVALFARLEKERSEYLKQSFSYEDYLSLKIELYKIEKKIKTVMQMHATIKNTLFALTTISALLALMNYAQD